MRSSSRRYVSRGTRRSTRVAHKRYVWERRTLAVATAAGALTVVNLLTTLEAELGYNPTGLRVERVEGQLTCVATTAAALSTFVGIGVMPAPFAPAAGYLNAAEGRYHSWQWYQHFQDVTAAAITAAAAAAPYGVFTRLVSVRSKRLLRAAEDQYNLVIDNTGAAASLVAIDLNILCSLS